MRRFVGEEKNVKLVDCCLRLFVIPLSVASIFFTLTNRQDNTIYGELHFSNIKGFNYIVWFSAISGGYALLAAVFTWFRFLVTKAWLLFLSDQVVAYLMITSVGAVGEMVYLMYNGDRDDRDVSWSEACTSYGRFCNKLKLILGLNSLAFFSFFILAVMSAYRVFSLCEPPFVPSKEVEDDERT